MKKHVKKLSISRETLRSLDLLHGAAGGSVHPTIAPGCADPTVYGSGCTGTGSYGQCAPTYNGCSTGCETGGTACSGSPSCFC